MNIVISTEDYARHRTAALIVGCWQDGVAADLFLAELDRKLAGALTNLYPKEADLGKLNRVSVIPACGLVPAERLIVVGLGKLAEISPDRLRQAAASGLQAVRGLGVTSCSLLLPSQPQLPVAAVRLAIEGALLGNYRFDEYRAPENAGVAALTLLCPAGTDQDSAAAAVHAAQTVSRWVLYARDLVSHPGIKAVGFTGSLRGGQALCRLTEAVRRFSQQAGVSQ